jgi:hypothetical protein
MLESGGASPDNRSASLRALSRRRFSNRTPTPFTAKLAALPIAILAATHSRCARRGMRKVDQAKWRFDLKAS